MIIHEPLSGFKLSAGGSTDFYVDVKKAEGDPYTRELMAKMLARRVRPYRLSPNHEKMLNYWMFNYVDLDRVPYETLYSK